MIPQPNATASQGTSRPAPTSASLHARICCAARRASWEVLSGQTSAGLRPAADHGRQTAARPRDRSCSAIARLASEGKAIVVISSEMPELLGICDRIYVMNEGRMVGEMAAAGASQEKIMRAIVRGEGKAS